MTCEIERPVSLYGGEVEIMISSVGKTTSNNFGFFYQLHRLMVKLKSKHAMMITFHKVVALVKIAFSVLQKYKSAADP